MCFSDITQFSLNPFNKGNFVMPLAYKQPTSHTSEFFHAGICEKHCVHQETS
jgi:hypothetical protein